MNNKKIKSLSTIETKLLQELSQLIDRESDGVPNSSISTLAFWEIGFRINEAIIPNNEPELAVHLVANIAEFLGSRYGLSFTERQLRRMMQFADNFNDRQLVAKLSRHLSLSHFLILHSIKTPEARIESAFLLGEQLKKADDLSQVIQQQLREKEKRP